MFIQLVVWSIWVWQLQLILNTLKKCEHKPFLTKRKNILFEIEVAIKAIQLYSYSMKCVIYKDVNFNEMVGNKWIFKINEGILGVKPQRFKDNLMAKGFTQREGVNYKSTMRFFHW